MKEKKSRRYCMIVDGINKTNSALKYPSFTILFFIQTHLLNN